MNFGASDSENRLRAEVHDVLSKPAVRDALTAMRAGGEREPDVRPLYQALAHHGLLAVSWPAEYGGRGASHSGAAAVMEELVRGGVPDMLHVLSVQIVGLFLLQAGSDEQKARYLPALAAGECFATVLYTEPEVGSDLASLRTSAVRDGDGYRLSGVKVFGLKSGVSDLGLCAVRTGQGASKYEGISLFLVDLHADGVRHSTIASVADEQFDRVELNDVWVGADALLGAEGDGWSLLTRCLAIERTGLDYSLKAERWFTAAVAGIGPGTADGALREEVGRHGAAVNAGRLLAREVISRLDQGELDPTAAAMAKYHTSETAQEVATWAALVHGYGYGLRDLNAADAAVLEAGYREAPGLTLSAGTSQIMLELVASSAFDRPEANGRGGNGRGPDPVLERIGRTVRVRLAAVGETRDNIRTDERSVLRDIDALAFESPVTAGGLDLGLRCGVVVCTELGRRALRDVYTGSLLVVDALAAGDDRDATTASVIAGELLVVAAGLDLVSVGGASRDRLAARRVVGGWALSGKVLVDDTGLPVAACCVPLVADDDVWLALLPDAVWRPRATGSVNRLTLALDGLTVGDARIVGQLGRGSPLSDPAGLLARTRLRHAAYLLGLGEGAHELAVRYASGRHQSGRPILEYQAIAFPLAQTKIALSAARLSIHQAAWLADAGETFALEAVESVASAAETALRIIRTAIQVHGARGMSLESPIHAYYQVARDAVTWLGPAGPLWREAGVRRLATAKGARREATVTG